MSVFKFKKKVVPRGTFGQIIYAQQIILKHFISLLWKN